MKKRNHVIPSIFCKKKYELIYNAENIQKFIESVVIRLADLPIFAKEFY